MDVQVCLPPVLATIYNFIYVHDPKKIDDMLSPSNIGINDIENKPLVSSQLNYLEEGRESQ